MKSATHTPYWLPAEFHATPEVRHLSLEAIGLYVACGVWSARWSEAPIHTEIVRMYAQRKHGPEWELIESGLWLSAERGYQAKHVASLCGVTRRPSRLFQISTLLPQSVPMLQAGTSAMGVWAMAASKSAAGGHPGFIQAFDAAPFSPQSCITSLLATGLWVADDDGYYLSKGDHPLEEWWTLARGDERAPIPDDIRQRVYERDGYRCVFCGSTRQLTLDHVIPWSLWGPDTEDNLQTLCRSCNSRKGART